MKRILCVILTFVCILAFSSCNLLEKFISFDRVETNAPTAQDPNGNEAVTPGEDPSDVQKPNDDDPDVTTYWEHDCTTPEESAKDDPDVTTYWEHDCTTPEESVKDENNDRVPDGEQTTDPTQGNQPDAPNPGDNNNGDQEESTTGLDDVPVVPEPETVTVQIIYQTGGVHCVQSNITTTAPATLLEVYNLFANEHPYEMFNNAECYLNDKPIDPTQTIYVQNGDKIYLQESGDGYHLHIWDIGMGRCRSCMEECSHEWEGNKCRICKCECYHNGFWINGQCGKCGTPCQHEQWNDSRQCIVCGEFLGVDLLYIEIYENGEYMFESQNIEITLSDLLMAYYPYPWAYMEANYEFYFNGTPIPDGSYMIIESGRLDIVTRSYE